MCAVWAGLLLTAFHIHILPSADGQPARLQDRLRAGPVVQASCRGGCCPCRNLQLRACQAELPVPATFVPGTDGAVALASVAADHRLRRGPDDIIRASERLAA